jgi:N-acyl-D-amino-acid deacylase
VLNNNYILIKNGTLVSREYDSSKRDILIRGKKILEIKEGIKGKKGWDVIDAQGKMVSPGFMSVHSHDDFYLPLKEHPQLLKSMLYQGITTSVGGNCGISNYPIMKNQLKNIESYQGFLHYKKADYRWETLGEYLEILEGNIILNYIPLVGHGTLRVLCNGFEKNLGEKARSLLKQQLRDCLDQGCFGMSSGLMYMPGTFSTTDELVELVKILQDYPRTLYSSHLRGYSDTYVESVKEAIEIGKKTGVRVQCSHLGPFGVKFGPKIEEVLDLMDDANKGGVPISHDSLAYCGGSTTIMALLPPWSYRNGLEKFLKDLKSDNFYGKVIDYLESYVPKWPSWEGTGWTDNFVRSLGWANLYVLSAQNQDFVGKNFQQIGGERGIDKHEALREVLIEEKGSAIMYMAGVGSCIDDTGDMSYFDTMIEHPRCIITVDAIFSPDGRTMPYAYGTFPRIVNRYVKTKRTMTLKGAIERFSSKVAELFDIKDRGYLKEGAYADIVIFDLEKMRDYPDVFAAKPKLSSGVEYLLINGKAVIDNGRFNETLNGEVIKNTK